MSYILDALRRADSERERGAIPGIHAQPVPAGSADAESRRGPVPALWVVAGSTLALLAVWVWWNGAGSDAPAELAQQPLAGMAAPTAATQAPAPTAAAPVARGAVEPAPVVPGRPPIARRAAPAAAPVAAARPAPKPAAAAPEPSAERRVHALDQLPAEIRSELPALALGGSIYSENPANRFLIVNGQTFRENDKVAAQLTLERIQRNAAVFEFKGYRYSLPY